MRKKVQVVAVVSFENIRKNDVGKVDLTPRIKALIDRGYLRMVEDVSLPDRPSADQSSEQGGSEAGVGDRGAASSEPVANPDAS